MTAEEELAEAKRNAAKALSIINSFVVVDPTLAPIMQDIDIYVRRIVSP